MAAKSQRSDKPEHPGLCVLCTPAAHPNRDEYDKVTMEMEIEGVEVRNKVRVCEEHHYVIARCLAVLSDELDWDGNRYLRA